MNTPKTVKKQSPYKDPSTRGFDITCTIGRVEFGNGDKNPHVAAFELIAEHDTEGTFRFPNADGSTCVVTVTYES